MEKELNTQEKKELWNDLESFKLPMSILSNQKILDGIREIQDSCRPLFITSIDKVPIWEGDEVYWINLQGAIILGKAINNFKELRPREETASTREACEQWIADNRSISVKDVYEVFDKWHSEYDSNTNYREWIHKFKSMIELKLKHIGK